MNNLAMSSRFLQNKAIYSPKNKKCPQSIPKFSSGGMPIIIDRNYGHTLKSEPCFNEAVTVYKKNVAIFRGRQLAGTVWLSPSPVYIFQKLAVIVLIKYIRWFIMRSWSSHTFILRLSAIMAAFVTPLLLICCSELVVPF